MDQKGTAFHADLALLDRLCCSARQTQGRASAVLADNVLRPGAPVYCWTLRFGHAGHRICPAEFYSLPEFLEETMGVEDWMAVTRR